jgi:nucleoid-associated protein YgaU
MQNPNANWSNLFTGLAVLFIVAIFSYAYFSRTGNQNPTLDLSEALKEVQEGGGFKTPKPSGKTTEGENVTVEDNTPEIPAEPGEKGSEWTGKTAVVQKGEGLWQVAQRVCGDSEKYNILAAANNLNVWDKLEVGMTLKVICN